MAKSSKPREIVVVGSKVKETSSPPAGLGIDLDDLLLGTLSWDVDLTLSSSSPPPGYAFSFVDDFEPASTLELDATTLTEDPLGIVIGINDTLPEVGDEVLVSFSATDPSGNPYQIDLHLVDPTGAAFDAAGLTTPLNLQLGDFATATVELSELGAPAPFATADIESIESFVVPEPAGIVLAASMLGTFFVGWLFGREGRSSETK